MTRDASRSYVARGWDPPLVESRPQGEIPTEA